MKINRQTLGNGLRIVHNFDPATPMIGVTVLYDVGSKDENPDKTGLAHLFEHLMFEGSVNIPDYDKELQNAGGENNAWTNQDMTCFYLSVPAQNIETAFWLESDRMLSLSFDSKGLETQKHVVTEEFKETCLNQPYGDIQHILRKLVYKKHPYRWPVIGKNFLHIESVGTDDIKEFFYQHYAPNNAILSVSGNISFEKTAELADKWFGSLPERKIKERTYPKEPCQKEPEFIRIKRKVPANALYKAYRICGRKDPGYPICDMLSDMLANGRSSRLYRSILMKKNIFTEINAFVSGETDPGTLQIQGKLAEGSSLKEADESIREEIEKLFTGRIEDRELEKVKNKYESNDLFSNMNYLDRSTNMAYFELLGNAGLINSEVNKYRNVTKEQLQKEAKKIFDFRNCSTVFYEKI